MIDSQTTIRKKLHCTLIKTQVKLFLFGSCKKRNYNFQYLAQLVGRWTVDGIQTKVKYISFIFLFLLKHTLILKNKFNQKKISLFCIVAMHSC